MRLVCKPTIASRRETQILIPHSVGGASLSPSVHFNWTRTELPTQTRTAADRSELEQCERACAARLHRAIAHSLARSLGRPPKGLRGNGPQKRDRYLRYL